MEFITKNIYLVLIALVSGGMLMWPLVRRGAGGPSVSTLEATQLINRSDALVVDLRSAEAYAKGQILGARSIPLANLERRAGELEKLKTNPFFLHCADRIRNVFGIHVLRQKDCDM